MEPHSPSTPVSAIWTRFELPTQGLTYTDYEAVLTQVQAATGQIARTQALFTGVIVQANRLGYPSEWAVAERRFETLACRTGDRAGLMRIELRHQAGVEAALDLVNQRATRFPRPVDERPTRCWLPMARSTSGSAEVPHQRSLH